MITVRQPVFDRHLRVAAYAVALRGVDAELVRDWESVLAELDATLPVCATTVDVHGGSRVVPIILTLPLALLAYREQRVAADVPIILVVSSQAFLDEIDRGAIAQLTQLGYRILVEGDPSEMSAELLLLADYVRVDLQHHSAEAVSHLAARLPPDVALAASHVEDYAAVQYAIRCGCSLLQSGFLALPAEISGRRLDVGSNAVLQLVAALNEPEITLAQIERIIQADPALFAGVLRLVNSAALGARSTIDSLAQAIRVLGIDRLRQWVSVISFVARSSDQDELVRQTLQIARLAELVAPGMGLQGSLAFMAGMLGGLAELLCLPAEQLVNELNLIDTLRAALLDDSSPYGTLLCDVRMMTQGYIDKVSPDFLARVDQHSWYLDSLNWAAETIRAAADHGA